MTHLHETASRVRQAMVAIAPLPWRFARLSGFPKGCCKDASFLLAHHFALNNGYGQIEYVWGMREPDSFEWWSHGWLEIDGYIVDITSDQFVDGCGPVFVGAAAASAFHAKFQLQSRSPYPTFWRFHPEARADFHASYEAVLRELDNLGRRTGE